MNEDTTIGFRDPAGFSVDPLTGILRQGARSLLQQAIEAGLADLMSRYAR